MSIRRPAGDRLDAEAVPPGCVCDAQQADRIKALTDLRAMATHALTGAGTNTHLVDLCLDIINRIKGLS